MDSTRMGGAEGIWVPGSIFKLLVHFVRHHQHMTLSRAETHTHMQVITHTAAEFELLGIARTPYNPVSLFLAFEPDDSFASGVHYHDTNHCALARKVIAQGMGCRQALGV